MDWSREFLFELLVCRWAERHWPPTGNRPSELIVGRQFGTSGRRWDTIVITTTTTALQQRARFGMDPLDRDLLRVVRHAPAEWAWYRDAIPKPSFPWRYVREAVHQAADREIIRTRNKSGRLQYRRRWEYPDWPEQIIAIENKPDLTKSAARTLKPQLEYDIALGLADETWLATLATDNRVEPALIESLPVEAGIMTIDPQTDETEVLWYPQQLAPTTWGTRISERGGDGAMDQSAARIEYVDPAWKRQTRLRIAEQVYANGWRKYIDAMRPDCRFFELVEHNTGYLPYCTAKEQPQSQRECAASCPLFEPEPPHWRTDEWPINGGPGQRLKTVLQTRRDRRRPTDQ